MIFNYLEREIDDIIRDFQSNDYFETEKIINEVRLWESPYNVLIDYLNNLYFQYDLLESISVMYERHFLYQENEYEVVYIIDPNKFNNHQVDKPLTQNSEKRNKGYEKRYFPGGLRALIHKSRTHIKNNIRMIETELKYNDIKDYGRQIYKIKDICEYDRSNKTFTFFKTQSVFASLLSHIFFDDRIMNEKEDGTEDNSVLEDITLKLKGRVFFGEDRKGITKRFYDNYRDEDGIKSKDLGSFLNETSKLFILFYNDITENSLKTD